MASKRTHTPKDKKYKHIKRGNAASGKLHRGNYLTFRRNMFYCESATERSAVFLQFYVKRVFSTLNSTPCGFCNPYTCRSPPFFYFWFAPWQHPCQRACFDPFSFTQYQLPYHAVSTVRRTGTQKSFQSWDKSIWSIYRGRPLGYDR